MRIRVGDDRMAGSDDPLFLRLHGPCGRDFRLSPARGRALRRASEDVFVLGSGDANVAHPELNDPSHPALALEQIEGAALWKGNEPLPNVRGIGEMDDRLLVAEACVEVHASGRAAPVRFTRQGPVWLGLVCGLQIELAREAAAP